MISKRTAKVIGLLPKPLVRKISKFVINGYMSKYAHITVVNEKVLKDERRPIIFICNHLSNSDGLVLNRVLGEGSTWFVAGVKLAQNDLTKLGLDIVKTVPISPSSPDRSAISKVINLVKSGQSVCIFPEGTRSRTGSLMRGKKGIILIAKLCNVPIVPIGIEGTEKLMPINDEDMGKEKFYDADVKVTVGEAFRVPDRQDGEDKTKYEERVLEYIMKRIAAQLSPKYRGIYKE